MLIGVLFAWCGFAWAVNEIAVIYNGEGDLPQKVSLGSWGYMPQEVRVTNASTGQDITVDNSAYLYPGMPVRVDGDTPCRIETVVGTAVHLSTAVNVDAGSYITIDNPFRPVRMMPNRKLYGLSMLTLGRYQGVVFDLAEPLDATALFADKNNFLELYLRAAADDRYAFATPVPHPEGETPETAPAGPQPPPANQTEINPPGTTPAGPAPPPVRPRPGGVEGFPSDMLAKIMPKPLTVPLPSVKNLRFTFFTEKGQGLLTIKAEDFYPKDEVNRYWIRVGVPLSTLNPLLPVGGKLSRILVTSDEPIHFLLGRLAFVHDEDPIKVDMFVYPMFLEAKKRIFFAARVEPGLARFQTTWCFNTAAGDTVDAMGDRVTYTFDKEGTYNIKCQVKDMTGGKLTVNKSKDLRVARSKEE